MIAPESIDLATLPSVALCDRGYHGRSLARCDAVASRMCTGSGQISADNKTWIEWED